MNLSIKCMSSVLGEASFLFKNHLSSFSTTQQKKILIIATAVFSFLAVAVWTLISFQFKAKKMLVKEKLENDYSDKVHLNVFVAEKLEMVNQAGSYLTMLQLKSLDDENLKEFMGACPNLQKLKLSFCHITNASLEYLPTGLQELSLSCCNKITGETLKNLKDLKILYLWECKKITDECLKNLPQNLKMLDLSDCNKITDEGLKSLPQDLETLVLSNCDKITDDCLKNLPKNLKILSLSDCNNLTDAGIKALPKTLRVII